MAFRDQEEKNRPKSALLTFACSTKHFCLVRFQIFLAILEFATKEVEESSTSHFFHLGLLDSTLPSCLLRWKFNHAGAIGSKTIFGWMSDVAVLLVLHGAISRHIGLNWVWMDRSPGGVR